MNSSLHIAFFVSSLPRGAIQRMVMNLAQSFHDRGHRIDLVACRIDGPRPPELSDPIRIIDLGSRQTARRKRYYVPAATLRLKSYLENQRPHILLSGGEYPNVTALFARRLAGTSTRIVVGEHIHLSHSIRSELRRRKWLLPRLVQLLYPQADGIIGVSHGVAHDTAKVARLPQERVTPIYNPVVTPALLKKREAPCSHPWFQSGRPPVVLAVGQLRAQKDFPTLLRAFARVRTRHSARLVILGEGNKRSDIEALIRSLGLTEDVALPGLVDNPLSYMVHARVFVLSSAWEGLPTVLIEALLCGCPVVSTDCPSGPSEILDHGRYGSLVPVGDDEALAQGILSVLENPPDTKHLQERAMEFSAEHSVDKHLHLMHHILKNPDTPGWQ